jgi:hypothetical protein
MVRVNHESSQGEYYRSGETGVNHDIPVVKYGEFIVYKNVKLDVKKLHGTKIITQSFE